MAVKFKTSKESSVHLVYIDKKSSRATKYIKTNKTMSDKRYNGEICVDIDKDLMVGKILIGDTKDKGFICNLLVSEAYRRKGIASRLLKDAIQKYGGYDLTVRKTNSAAIALYKKFGFVIDKNANMKNDEHYYMILKSKQKKG